MLIFRLGRGSLTVREDRSDVLTYRAPKTARLLRMQRGALTDAVVEAVFAVARSHRQAVEARRRLVLTRPGHTPPTRDSSP